MLIAVLACCIIALTFLVFFSKYSITNTERTLLLTSSPTPLTKKTSEKHFGLYSTLSPDHKFVSFLSLGKQGELFKIELVVDALDGIKNSVLLDKTKELQMAYNAIWTELIPVDDISFFTLEKSESTWPNMDDYNDVKLTWSHNGGKLAFLQKDRLTIFSFDLENNIYHIYTNPDGVKETKFYELQLKFVKSKDYPLPFELQSMFSSKSYIRIFFSGSDKYVYIVTGMHIDSVYRADVFSGKVEKVFFTNKIENLPRIFPVPNSDAITYADKNLLIIDFGSSKKSYTLKDENIDYTGKVILSPNLEYVCIEWGSSGYWGYNVYKLSSGEKISQGPQYSYCRGWRDNVNLVVVENPFFHTDFWYWYNINILAREKVFLDRVESPE